MLSRCFLERTFRAMIVLLGALLPKIRHQYLFHLHRLWFDLLWFSHPLKTLFCRSVLCFLLLLSKIQRRSSKLHEINCLSCHLIKGIWWSGLSYSWLKSFLSRFGLVWEAWLFLCERNGALQARWYLFELSLVQAHAEYLHLQTWTGLSWRNGRF